MHCKQCNLKYADYEKLYNKSDPVLLTKTYKKKIRDRSENVLKDFQGEASDDVRLQSVLKSTVHRKLVTCRPFYASTPREK